jgi:hypothetical protein
MRLTSTGLGIGTSSFSTKLAVNGISAFYSTSVGAISLGSKTNFTSTFENQAGGYGLGVHVAGSGNVGLQVQNFGSAASYDMVLQPLGGNLGLGVTPSAWAGVTAIDMRSAGAIATGDTSTGFVTNGYFNGSSWIYKTSNYAGRYLVNTSGQHIWFTAPSGTAGNAISFTQAMTLDASGNLGVGTTSPSSKLHVAGTGTQGITVERTDATTAGLFQLLSGNSVNVVAASTAKPISFEINGAERMRIDSSGNVGIGTSSPSYKLHLAGTTGFTGAEISDGTDRAILGWHTADGYRITVVAAKPLVFKTSDTERMRIDSSGNLLVGTTTTNTASTTGGVIIQANTIAVQRTGNVMAFYAASQASPAGTITVTSNTTTAYNTSSDYRLKENIKPMQNALAFCRKQRPVDYIWKADGSKGSGYIAHWMQEDGAGNCVTGEKDAVDKDDKPIYQGIDTSFMVAPLNAGLNELADIVEAQAEMLAQLKAELDATKAEVAAIKGVK